MTLWLDIETASVDNVTDHGAYRHSECAHLDITCAAYAVDDGPVKLWNRRFSPGPMDAEPCPDDLRAVIEGREITAAHNAAYERIVWNSLADAGDVDMPRLELDRMIDTAVLARWHNLPGDLDRLSTFLLPASDRKSGDAPKELFAAMTLTEAHREPYRRLAAYCAQDVHAMRECCARMLSLPERTWEEWRASERINDRGVMVDLDFAAAAVAMRSIAEREVKAEIERLTDGALDKLRGPSVRLWAEGWLKANWPDCPLLDPETKALSRAFKTRRTDAIGFTSARRATFDRPMRADLTEALNAWSGRGQALLDVVALVDEAGRAAVSKYEAMLDRTSTDGRLRGMYVFAGAGQTHRYSSVGAQTHNMIRGGLGLDADFTLRNSAEEALQRIEGGLSATRSSLVRPDGMGVGEALGLALRPTLHAAPGKVLLWRDWSAVEARGLPWLADRPGGRDLLARFAAGQDVYVAEAKNIHGSYDERSHPEAGARRQIGKVAILSLGYGGAAGAFRSMGRNYGVSLPDAAVDVIVDKWRKGNRWATDFWADLMQAAEAAVRDPGEVKPAGRVGFLHIPDLMSGTLVMILPDDSLLFYPSARFRDVARFENSEPEPAVTFIHPAYGPSALWHGGLAENATQGICASLLRAALLRCDQAGLDVVLHTHDEIVLECEDDDDVIEAQDAKLKEIMDAPADWTTGLPLASEGAVGGRYYLADSVTPI